MPFKFTCERVQYNKKFIGLPVAGKRLNEKMLGTSIRCIILRAFNSPAAAQIAKGHVERGYGKIPI